MKFIGWALAALALSGCAWLRGEDDVTFVSPAFEDSKNIVPASFDPVPPPRPRVATGRPSAIVPCVTGARITDLCRRDAEAHLYAGASEPPQ
jgi:hypothetical protein